MGIPSESSVPSGSSHKDTNGITENLPLLATTPGHRRSTLQDRAQRNSISALELSRLHGHHLHHSPLTIHHQPHMGPTPFYQMLLSTKYTVTNPMLSAHDLAGPFDGVSCGSAADLESDLFGVNPYRRMSILNSLRPERLIGHYRPLAQWTTRHVDVGSGSLAAIRRFYDHQNYLIEKYDEIDNFLDYGKVHLNMLSTYTNGSGTGQTKPLDPLMEEPADETNGDGGKSRLNTLPGNISEGGHFLGYDEEQSSVDVRVAILVNFVVNFLLLVGKIVVSVLTNSLSVVASLVDSVLDFLSTFIIYIANRLSNTMNWRTQIAYPIGRTKLEPLGVLIFSVIIIISFFQVGLESFKKLFFLHPSHRHAVEIGLDAMVIMVVTILSKVVCWWWCARSSSSSVQALAQDAMTDVVFNTVSLIMPTVGYFADIWWLDPAGALLLSVYIIVSWSFTAFEHIDNLTGAVASSADYKVVLYMAYRFAECIKQITALKVYHVGDNLNVEIDIVFDTDAFEMSFKDAHDIAEALQYALETLPMVERAFVHIDYMVGNFKGHLK